MLKSKTQNSNVKSNLIFMVNSCEKGVSIYFALIIMVILLALVLGISANLVSQTKMIRGMGDSVFAFYAADSGIEEVMDKREDLCGGSPPPCEISTTTLSLSPNIGYRVEVNTSSTMPSCTAPNYCIQSLGWHEQTRRAIEVKY